MAANNGSPNFVEIFSEVKKLTSLIKQIVSLRWEEFQAMLLEINKRSNETREHFKQYFVFTVKDGTADSLFWRTTIRIFCYKIATFGQTILANKLLTLREFIRFHSYLKMLLDQQESLAYIVDQGVECMPSSSSRYDVGQFSDDGSPATDECCICLERKKEVALSCFHGFCLACISQWNEQKNCCPICRTEIPDIEDVWIMTDFPDKEDMAKSIHECMDSINFDVLSVDKTDVDEDE